jgi:hypothetical protein
VAPSYSREIAEQLVRGIIRDPLAFSTLDLPIVWSAEGRPHFQRSAAGPPQEPRKRLERHKKDPAGAGSVVELAHHIAMQDRRLSH